jgi:hypothetical protein
MYDWKLLGYFDTEQDFKYFRSYYVTSFGEKRSHRAKCQKLCEGRGDEHEKKVTDACLEHRRLLQQSILS